MDAQPPLVRFCDNCHTRLQGEFCHQCGQEKKTYIRNLTGLITEFFGEFSNWDTRLWRTLLPLWFVPGYLSRRYVAGHRVPYVPPLRLYLFTSVIAFLLFAQLLPAPSVQVASPESVALSQAITEEVTANLAAQGIEVPAGVGNSQAEIPMLSAALNQQFNQKLDELVANPKLAINKFFSLAPQMMFLLLPLFALLLQLLYIRSKCFYTEHLIVALHSHSFILQMLVCYLLLQLLAAQISWPWLLSGINGLSVAVLCWIPLYLLLCQKWYYQQGWGKTLFKFWLTSSLYNLLFLSAFSGVIILSILWA